MHNTIDNVSFKANFNIKGLKGNSTRLNNIKTEFERLTADITNESLTLSGSGNFDNHITMIYSKNGKTYPDHAFIFQDLAYKLGALSDTEIAKKLAVLFEAKRAVEELADDTFDIITKHKRLNPNADSFEFQGNKITFERLKNSITLNQKETAASIINQDPLLRTSKDEFYVFTKAGKR